jgi:L,D-peptidoglycan transpeptidase YkuD (ErfK/YbiS/YcfS/YnhG family)
MKDKNIKQSTKLSARMVEPEPVEKLKKRAQDLGLIVNAGVGKTGKLTGKRENKR